jgi:hypothetical protein
MIADLSKAVAIYTQMYWDRVRVERVHQAIIADANRLATINILQTTANMSNVFARNQEALFDIMERRCFICHKIIGIVGGGYHVKCAREARII